MLRLLSSRLIFGRTEMREKYVNGEFCLPVCFWTRESCHNRTRLRHEAARLFAEGQHLLAIPFDVLPGWLETLRELPRVPEPYGPNGLEYMRNLRLRLGLDEAK